MTTLLAILLCLLAAPNAGARPRRVLQAIRLAAVTYHVPETLLRRRAWCESRYDTAAVNQSSGAAGLFQFIASTWRSTPYAAWSRLDPYASALAAAWMVSVGRGGEWSCR